MLELLRSYLLERSQIVEIGRFKSTEMSINTGFFQGSLLGPLFYLIFLGTKDLAGLSASVAKCTAPTF